MGGSTAQPWSREAWALARRQHGVISRSQLMTLGMMPRSIEHRLSNGRLHPLYRGVYAVGRPQVGGRGHWMAAVLACGAEALLSHHDAAALWGIARPRGGDIHVVVAAGQCKRRLGIRAHRRCDHTAPGRRLVDNIPVTHPVATVVDLAACVPDGELEALINEADHFGLFDPVQLRKAIETVPRRPGTGRLRRLLDGPTVTLSTTALERRFLPLARAAGLPEPQTQAWLDGYRVDFFWPSLGLVVEADSLRYHRTPFKQARDKRRDNAHVGSGWATLRFTHGQICGEPGYVRQMLRRAARRLATSAKT